MDPRPFKAKFRQQIRRIAGRNAEPGMVALWQPALNDGGSRWPGPRSLYTPSRQDVVFPKKGCPTQAGAVFITCLEELEARAIIEDTARGLALDERHEFVVKARLCYSVGAS
jgi:hypothetical protein